MRSSNSQGLFQNNTKTQEVKLNADEQKLFNAMLQLLSAAAASDLLMDMYDDDNGLGMKDYSNAMKKAKLKAGELLKTKSYDEICKLAPQGIQIKGLFMNCLSTASQQHESEHTTAPTP